MDEMLQETMAGFDSVWQRVTGREPPVPDRPDAADLEDTLLALIHEEICAGAYAGALARMLSGDGRAVLLRHAADARRHLRRLRAEYFIATGVSAGSGQDCRAPTGKLASLRTAFLQAGELAGRYEAAASQASCPELRQALAAFAADERRRAQETRTLLIENF